jgi:hypothetical protein
MTDEQRLYRGNRAREVLENEEFQAAFEAIEKDLIESWKNTPSTSANQDARERIHLSLTMLGKVKASLTHTMETGKLAAEELKHRKRLTERLKEWATPN